MSSVSITLRELLEAGVHFGHQTRRWNPKMKPSIFGERNGIYIVDLQKTHKLFEEALQFVQELAAAGRSIMFVGTKRQAQDAIREEAERCGMPFVTERWLGGLLTNFVTIRRSLERLRELETMSMDGRHERLTKKEVARLEKERIRLDKTLLGIKGMRSLPDAVFVIDTGDPMMLYNCACLYSQLGELDRAIDTLRRAISGGYENFGWMRHDPDLDSLRAHSDFIALVQGR